MYKSFKLWLLPKNSNFCIMPRFYLQFSVNQMAISDSRVNTSLKKTNDHTSKNIFKSDKAI